MGLTENTDQTHLGCLATLVVLRAFHLALITVHTVYWTMVYTGVTMCRPLSHDAETALNPLHVVVFGRLWENSIVHHGFSYANLQVIHLSNFTFRSFITIGFVDVFLSSNLSRPSRTQHDVVILKVDTTGISYGIFSLARHLYVLYLIPISTVYP